MASSLDGQARQLEAYVSHQIGEKRGHWRPQACVSHQTCENAQTLGGGRCAMCAAQAVELTSAAETIATVFEPMTSADEVAVTAQLQRPPRGVLGVAYRCPCGRPAVVVTRPRLPDGTPFPTTYYLTCPRAVAACSALESQGLMAEMNDRLSRDQDLALAYRRAHEQYLADRERIDSVPEIAGVSAGGMPDRVKCLHALAAHALAAGTGINPLGEEAVEAVGAFWTRPCLEDAS